MRANQYGISMPTNSRRFGIKIDRPKIAMLDEDIMGKGRFSSAETPISLLQRNDIRLKFRDDRQNSLRTPETVRADGLANIVAGDPDHGGKLAASLAAAKPKGRKAVLVEFQAERHERPAARVAAILEVTVMETHHIVTH